MLLFIKERDMGSLQAKNPARANLIHKNEPLNQPQRPYYVDAITGPWRVSAVNLYSHAFMTSFL